MESNDVAMTFWEHLEELRRRIILIAIALGFCVIICLSFSKPIERVIKFPLETSFKILLADTLDSFFESEGTLIGFFSLSLRAGASKIQAELFKVGPIEGIMAYLKLGIAAGFLLASPFVIYQLWAFIFPALTITEKKYALPLFIIIVIFFIIGATFAYFIVTPVVLEFSAKLFPELPNRWDLDKYISFITKIILGFGIAFELPIVMAFLARIGVIDWRGFSSKQRHALLGIAVLSAVLTPADPWSMILMAIPLFLLYQLGIFFAFLMEKEAEI